MKRLGIHRITPAARAGVTSHPPTVGLSNPRAGQYSYRSLGVLLPGKLMVDERLIHTSAVQNPAQYISLSQCGSDSAVRHYRFPALSIAPHALESTCSFFSDVLRASAYSVYQFGFAASPAQSHPTASPRCLSRTHHVAAGVQRGGIFLRHVKSTSCR